MPHSICQQIWKTQQWPQDWKRWIFIPIPKGNSKECSDYWTVALISNASKTMIKILQARLQHYMNQEPRDVQAGLRKGRGTRDQIASIHWITEKARKFQKTSTSVSLTTIKPLTVNHNKLWKTLKQMVKLDHLLTCLLRNLWVAQEATVRTLYGTPDLFKIEKGVQDCLLCTQC